MGRPAHAGAAARALAWRALVELGQERAYELALGRGELGEAGLAEPTPAELEGAQERRELGRGEL